MKPKQLKLLESPNRVISRRQMLDAYKKHYNIQTHNARFMKPVGWTAAIVPPEFKHLFDAVAKNGRRLEEMGQMVQGRTEMSCVSELAVLNDLPPVPQTLNGFAAWKLSL